MVVTPGRNFQIDLVNEEYYVGLYGIEAVHAAKLAVLDYYGNLEADALAVASAPALMVLPVPTPAKAQAAGWLAKGVSWVATKLGFGRQAGGGAQVTKGVPGRGYHKETYANTPVKPRNVTDKWDDFLGPRPHSNRHPRTNEIDPDRIVSADGKRSIRYGSHEMNSKPTKHHYHEETWTYDPVNNVMNVDNTVVRVPLPKK